MSRPFLISEALSVFIRGTKPILLPTHERGDTPSEREGPLLFDRVPWVSSGCWGPNVE